MFYKSLRIKEYLLTNGSALHAVLSVVGATYYFTFIIILEELDPTNLA